MPSAADHDRLHPDCDLEADLLFEPYTDTNRHRYQNPVRSQTDGRRREGHSSRSAAQSQAMQLESQNLQALQALRYQLDIVVQDNNALRSENEVLKHSHAQADQALWNYRSTIDSQGEDIADLKSHVAYLEKKLGDATQGPTWSLRSLLGRSQEAPQTANAEVEGLRNMLADCNSTIKQLTLQNQELERRSSEHEKHIQSQRSDFAQELNELKNKTFFQALRVSDTDIQGRWKGLSFAVRQFVENHFPGSLDAATVRRLSQAHEFKWLPEAAKTLQAPLLCQIVLQAWIWHFLCFRILDSHSENWAGDIGQAFNVQCDEIRGEQMLIEMPVFAYRG